MEREIAIIICVIAIVSFAIALNKNHALSKKGMITAIIVSVGIGSILSLTL